jgi:hypothetical protein
MDVAANCNGRGDGLDVGLLHEDLSHARAKRLHLGLGQVLAFHQLREPPVRVVLRCCHSGFTGR